MSAKGEVDGTEKVCEAMHASVSETVSQTDEQTERKIFFFTRSGRERDVLGEGEKGQADKKTR